MKFYFNGIVLIFLAIHLSGCYQIAADFWNGNYEMERYKKGSEKISKICYQKLGKNYTSEELSECFDLERKKYYKRDCIKFCVNP